MNLEDQRVFLPSVEARRRDPPALDRLSVVRGFPSHALDLAEQLVAEQISVERGQDAYVAFPTDGDVAGITRADLREGQVAFARD